MNHQSRLKRANKDDPSRSQLEWYCAFFPGRLGGIPLELRGQGLQRSSVPAGSCSWPPLPPPHQQLGSCSLTGAHKLPWG